jgi:hypothetical protein
MQGGEYRPWRSHVGAEWLPEIFVTGKLGQRPGDLALRVAARR